MNIIKFKEKDIKSNKGIAMITLVVTIIILIIIASISLTRITGDDGLVNRAKSAKQETNVSDEKTLLETEVFSSKAENKRGNLEYDIVKSKIQRNIKDITIEPGNDFPILVTYNNSGNKYKIDDIGNVKQHIVYDRTGIQVGDYVTYTSPTSSVTFNKDETGYSSYESSPATLSRKTLFRVLDIKEDGGMDLLGVVTSSDPTIFFSGANGYNNAVYTLNKKCSDLYKDTANGITARSVREEDITSKYNSTGIDAISSYINSTVEGLATGSSITEVDKTNKKVTYVRRKGYYPDIFKYEAGGILDGTATTGEITGSQAYGGYNGLTALTYSQVTNNNGGTLTVPYTYISLSTTASYFDNTEGNASNYQNMFFGMNGHYWLASRCVGGYSGNADFYLRIVRSGFVLAGYSLFGSSGDAYDRSARVCPVVSLDSDVQVTKCSGTNSSSNTHTVVVSY